jgi:ubiquinone/menaquinone biosynthesis C-methylase UbiE
MSFDLLAPHYRWLESIVFGNALQEARTCWISNIPRPKRTLLLGEGNGRFLCELLRVHPKIDVDCLDASERMLQLARARLERLCPESCRSVRFLHCNVLDWSSSDSYDLVVTHFFLDCFERKELESVIAKIARVARENATWLIADFTIPRGTFARAHAMLWLKTMYAFFRVSAQLNTKRLIDSRRYVESVGFARISTRVFRWRMLQADIYARCHSNARPSVEPARLGPAFRC